MFLPDKPAQGDDFLDEIAKALGMNTQELAKLLGVFPREIRERSRQRHLTADPTTDDVLWNVSELIDERLGLLMAARASMNRLLDKSRTQRVVRNAAQMAREKKTRR